MEEATEKKVLRNFKNKARIDLLIEPAKTDGLEQKTTAERRRNVKGEVGETSDRREKIARREKTTEVGESGDRRS